jgi:thioredoxin reductase (NADPH)
LAPASLEAALYTSRDRLKTLVLEKLLPSGQIGTTDRIENYPGIRIDGPSLIERMQEQAVTFGAEIKTSSEVTALKKLQDGDIEVSCDKNKYIARAIIPASGSHIRNTGNSVEKE